MTGKQTPWQTDENKTSVRNARRGKKSNVGEKKEYLQGKTEQKKPQPRSKLLSRGIREACQS